MTTDPDAPPDLRTVVVCFMLILGMISALFWYGRPPVKDRSYSYTPPAATSDTP